jgi:hypothetical protein
MYNVNRGKQLGFRKILINLLNKKFIQIANSATAAPVLLAYKPGKKGRFCVDYRAFNEIIIKTRYSLSLIFEIFRNIAKVK